MAHQIDFTTGQAAIAYATAPMSPGTGRANGRSRTPASRSGRRPRSSNGAPSRPRSSSTAPSPNQRESFADKHVLYRSDCGAPLSVVSSDYQVVQPADILNFFGELAEAKQFSIETVGALMNGRRIWALGRVGDNARILDDEVAPYLLLATSYDGTMATVARFTTIRVVCNNTLQASLRNADAQRQVTISHQAIFDARAVRADLGIALDAWDEFQHKAGLMAGRKLTDLETDGWLQDLFQPFMPYGQTYTPEQVRKSKGYRRIVELFAGEMIGGHQDATDQTLWGLLNATTEYIDHEKGRLQDNRLNAAWFGPGARFKDHAYPEKLVTAAADRPDGGIHPLPARLPSGAKNKVVASLLTRDLIFETAVSDEIEYRLTAEGYAAVGRECELPAPIPADPEIETAAVAVEAEWVPDHAEPDQRVAVERKPRTRENSKQAAVVAMLQRPEGRNNCANLRIYRLASPHRARHLRRRLQEEFRADHHVRETPRQRTRLSRGLTAQRGGRRPNPPHLWSLPCPK
jgi:phage/plasmid-like protein (TIGR03299 family)